MQSRGQGVKRDKKAAFPHFARTIHAEDLFLGNILYITKKAPSPRFKLNPFLPVDLETGKIIVNEENRRILDKLENMLQGKFEDDNILEKEVIVEDINI